MSQGMRVPPFGPGGRWVGWGGVGWGQKGNPMSRNTRPFVDKFINRSSRVDHVVPLVT